VIERNHGTGSSAHSGAVGREARIDFIQFLAKAICLVPQGIGLFLVLRASMAVSSAYSAV
jgi:hypothetical protein